MIGFEVPETETYHVGAGEPHLAGRVPPGRCTDACANRGRMVWAVKGSVIDIDDEPDEDRARFGIPPVP